MISLSKTPNHPFYIMEIPDRLSFEDVTDYVSRLDLILSQGSPFGCILVYLGKTPKKDKLGEIKERSWLKENKDKFSKLCFGIAMVAHPGIEAILQKIVSQGLGKAFFGCNCNLFYHQEDAVDWLRSQYHASAAIVDLDRSSSQS